MKAGKILRRVFAVILIIFFAALVLRIFMLSDSRTLSDIYPTKAAKTAYSEDGEKAFQTHKPANEISSDGYYGAYAICYSESTEEMQLTVRYNDSLPERYLSGSDPDNYKWELRDGEGNVISHGTVLDTAEKYRYNYIRLAFDGVSIDKETQLSLFLICEECDYPDEDTKGFVIHKAGGEFKEYRLSSAEISALED